MSVREFAHDLGLPDEYDTSRNSAYGEPVSFWSIMSSGSWAGLIPGVDQLVSQVGRVLSYKHHWAENGKIV